eukprot:gene45386-33422_t
MDEAAAGVNAARGGGRAPLVVAAGQNYGEAPDRSLWTS